MNAFGGQTKFLKNLTTPLVIVIVSTPLLGARKDLCKTVLPAIVAASEHAFTAETDPYRYPDYHGPKNAILQTLLTAPAAERNPRFANICQHGKVYSWNEVFSAVGLNMEGRSGTHEMQVFINADDPMTDVTHRAPFIKGAYSIWNGRVADWILQQYPELREPARQWREASRDEDGMSYGIIKKQTFDQWLREHPD